MMTDRPGEHAPSPEAEPAVPPYEGRTESGEINEDPSATHVEGANVGGAGGPVADPNYKADKPEDTPGGATASPADEQPAAEQSETEPTDEGVGPAHYPGTSRGEEQ
jgi:hypothetical protein